MTAVLKEWHEKRFGFQLWSLSLLLTLMALIATVAVQVCFVEIPSQAFLLLTTFITVFFGINYWLYRHRFSKPSYFSRASCVYISVILPLVLTLINNMVGGPSWVYPLSLSLFFLQLPSVYHRFLWQEKNIFIAKGFKLIGLGFGILTVIHCLACAFMLFFPMEVSDLVTKYNLALYWTITTLTTVGYGDITPHGNLSRMYTMLVMLLGVGFYGFVISKISQYILSLDRRRQREFDQLDNLRALFSHYRIPHSLQDQTLAFFRHTIAKENHEDDSKILGLLPKSLASRIERHMIVRSLIDLDFFKNCSMRCLVDVARAMHQEIYAPGEVIIQTGDPGDKMYVLMHGSVRVHKDDKTIATIESGKSFGEMALCSKRKRNSNVSAISYCDILTLHIDAFDELVGEHHDLKQQVERVALERGAE